uniref:Uncharacterized protein n=1 Tax=Arundo donax TaxID=35708 RepID=A0A0A9BEJ9_ARUDO
MPSYYRPPYRYMFL